MNGIFTFPGRLLRCERGAVAIVLAFCMNFILILMGLVHDISRAQLVKTAMGASTDASGLAVAITKGIDKDFQAEKYFAANFPVGLFNVHYDFNTNVIVIISDDETTVTVTASSFDVPAYFYNFSNNDQSILLVGNRSVVGMSGSERVPTDYFLILDESGSMDDFMTPSPLSGNDVPGNIALRHSVQLMVDEVYNFPEADQFYSVSYTSYSTIANETSGLLSDAQELKAILPQYTQASGCTCASCGLDEALSFYDSSQGDRQKVYILMTDGLFNTVIGGEGCQGEPQALYEAMDICDVIKNENNTTIWTIGFGSDSHGSDLALKDCASSPNQYFYAPDGIALGEIFMKIARDTGGIRIVE